MKDPSLEASKGGWPFQNLDFGPLVFRTVNLQIFLVLSHPTGGHLLWQPL